MSLASSPTFLPHSDGLFAVDLELTSRATRCSDHEYGGNTRGEPGEKNWADMTTKDLERAAQDNHDRPLGTLVGDWRVKEKEGPEEGVRLPIQEK